MTIEEVTQFIMTCEGPDLIRISDAMTDRLEDVLGIQPENTEVEEVIIEEETAPVEEEVVEEEEVALPPISF